MKSKGKAFIYSLLPGGGHFYLGLYNRGIIFLLSTMVLSIGGREHGFGNYNFFGGINNLFDHFAFIVWVFSAVDAFMSADYINRGIINLEEETNFSQRNKNLLGIILSIIPGFGHIYEGYTDKGMKLFITFLAGIFINGLLNMQLVNTLILLLSVFSVLDLLALREGKGFGFFEGESKEFKLFFKIVGVVLVFFGISQALQNAGFYFADFGYNYIFNTISVFIKAAIFIIIGLIVIYKTRK
ncbi:hypothetical protein [Clostridium sp. YIM B02551]|uniref:hypothetical protein n=1 Tax=Clostridium sp. YIM B02551 TaxID=2910679 RepID=UPI001EEB0054|nr:hypothetical protein [Clostridium sp. YIM B02551]